MQPALESEFLSRLLGTDEEGATGASVRVFPDAWADDFPLEWPDLPGTRVWGSVRSAATRWIFTHDHRQPPAARQLTRWRACLDVSSPQPEVMASLRTAFAGQGWQAAQMWQQAFVEYAQTTWNAVHVPSSRLLTLQTRAVGAGVTGVWLTVQELEEEAVGHWLGRPAHPQFGDFYQAPLPVLSAPPGWQVMPQGGSGGADRSESAVLIPPDGQALDLAALLAAFGSQLTAQGWNVLPTALDRDGPNVRIAAQTPQGFGALGLEQRETAVHARLVHLSFEHTDSSGHSSYTLVSS